jgi:anaerobic ribonucleoside-triphosphate reductase
MICNDCGKTLSEKKDRYTTCNACGSAAHFQCDPNHICLGITPSGPSAFGTAMQDAMERKGLTVEELAAVLTANDDDKPVN